jgi:geranylgeranyl reductase family protein
VADERFDVLVVGSGPAGSVAALVLARGGARVALVDKASFPRDKACGDLIGPRGVQLLIDLDLALPGALPVGDMLIIGPTGRRIRLPSASGFTYPGYGLAVRRADLDALLHDAAVDAGAESIQAQAIRPLDGGRGLEGFELSNGMRVRADAIVGADGATSRVAQAAGLVDARRVLWGFALRSYADESVRYPSIVWWDEGRWRALPGYGWLFPGPDGRANLGLGIGTLADRTTAGRAARLMPAFVDHLHEIGLLDARPSPARLGGWLKMGMIGTEPTAPGVLLVGDAAGLVNPLQGEGISQAMASGRAAAEALLAGPARAEGRYRSWLVRTQAPHQRVAAVVQAMFLPRPRATAGLERVLTLPFPGRALAGGWSIYWNDLLDGAPPSTARSTATAVAGVGRLATRTGATRRWFDTTLDGDRTSAHCPTVST